MAFLTEFDGTCQEKRCYAPATRVVTTERGRDVGRFCLPCARLRFAAIHTQEVAGLRPKVEALAESANEPEAVDAYRRVLELIDGGLDALR